MAAFHNNWTKQGIRMRYIYGRLTGGINRFLITRVIDLVSHGDTMDNEIIVLNKCFMDKKFDEDALRCVRCAG